MSATGDDPELGLDDAYAVDGPDDNRKLYASWAATYESGFITDSRYVYHRHVADIFSRGFEDRDEAVLDVGCGTGIVGEELRRLGVAIVDGIDISPEMLHQAQAKADTAGAVYRNLIEADLTGPIDVPSNQYGGVISAGTFTHGHLGPDALSELVRVARAGARFAIGINAAHFDDHGFRARLDRFRDDGAIGDYELVDSLIYDGADPNDLDQIARVAVFWRA